MKQFTFYYTSGDMIEQKSRPVEFGGRSESRHFIVGSTYKDEFHELWDKIEVFGNNKVDAFQKMLNKLPAAESAVFTEHAPKSIVENKDSPLFPDFQIIINKSFIDKNEFRAFFVQDYSIKEKKAGGSRLLKHARRIKNLKKILEVPQEDFFISVHTKRHEFKDGKSVLIDDIKVVRTPEEFLSDFVLSNLTFAEMLVAGTIF